MSNPLDRGVTLPPHSRMVIAERHLGTKHFRYVPALSTSIKDTFARAQREIERKKTPSEI